MKKYLLSLFLIMFVVPSIASASWWNPISWFSKNEPKETGVLIEETLPSPVILAPTEITKELEVPQATQDTKVIERIVEKPVIQTIKVQDPALQAQINSLVSENTSLKNQIDKLTKANNSLSNDLISCEESSISVSSPVEDRLEENKQRQLTILRQIKSDLPSPSASANNTDKCNIEQKAINNLVFQYNLLGGASLSDYPACGYVAQRETYKERLDIMISNLEF